MATSLPLPKLSDLPKVVVFHRRHPSDQRFVMQVPTSEDTSETFVIDSERVHRQEVGSYDPRRDHQDWLKRLPNAQGLKDLLSIEMHVAYFPHDGGVCRALEDPDKMPWMREVMAQAARGTSSTMNNHFMKRRLKNKIALKHESPVRAAFRGRGGQRW